MRRKQYPSDVTDAQWAILEPLLSPVDPEGRPLKIERREIVNAIFGSGSHEVDSPFQIVAMEEEVQTHSMHHHTFGEGKRFANKSPKTLS